MGKHVHVHDLLRFELLNMCVATALNQMYCRTIWHCASGQMWVQSTTVVRDARVFCVHLKQLHSQDK